MTATEPTTDFVDLRFALQGRVVCLDYADALIRALTRALPWLDVAQGAGVHPLGGLSPGDDGWYLSGRTRLTLRLPRCRVEDAQQLTGETLVVGGHELRVGACSERPLAHTSVVYASFVSFGVEPGGGIIDETVFLDRCRRELETLNLSPRLVCGKAHQIKVAAGLLSGFSLMVADLDVAGTLRLQERGLGCERLRGCGLFVPHKSMRSVTTLE